MVTINFYSVKERKPKSGQDVIYLKTHSSFDYTEFIPKEAKIEYQWEEIDEAGFPTGNSAIYEDQDEAEEGWRLVIMANGWELYEEDLWCPLEEIDQAFEAYDNEFETSKEI